MRNSILENITRKREEEEEKIFAQLQKKDENDEIYVAIRSFKGNTAIDLHLKEGDEIYVTEKNETNYWFGKTIDGTRQGIFRCSCVVKKNSPEHKKFLITQDSLVRSSQSLPTCLSEANLSSNTALQSSECLQNNETTNLCFDKYNDNKSSFKKHCSSEKIPTRPSKNLIQLARASTSKKGPSPSIPPRPSSIAKFS